MMCKFKDEFTLVGIVSHHHEILFPLKKIAFWEWVKFIHRACSIFRVVVLLSILKAFMSLLSNLSKVFICTVKNGVLRYTFAMVFWDTFIYVGVT